MNLAKGEFHCQVCKELLFVDPEDERTFLSKTEHDQFFGMQLVTYRVAHTIGDEQHINTIILDQKGYFRGHRDSYSEKIRTSVIPRAKHYWTIFQEVPSLSESRLVRMAFITDMRDRWVLELVAPEGIKIRELALMAVDRVEEAQRVYETPPDHLRVNIADHELEIWLKDSRLLCVETRPGETAELLERLATWFLNSQRSSHIPSKQLMIFAMGLIEEHPELLSCPDLMFHF